MSYSTLNKWFCFISLSLLLALLACNQTRPQVVLRHNTNTNSLNSQVLEQKLTANDGEQNDLFARSVAISGDIAIVGAFLEDDKGTNAGAAYIFIRSGNTWVEQAKLTASDGGAGDRFGSSVSIDNNTVIISAPNDDDEGTNAGAAYIFTRSGSTWIEQDKLTVSDSDGFGNDVAISGDTVIVGASEDFHAGPFSGAAYIFTRSGSNWNEQAKLIGSDPGEEKQFGWSVAIDGDSAIVGAILDYPSSGTVSGAAYTFARSNSIWTEQAKIIPTDASSGDRFGWSVAISNDTALIGAKENFVPNVGSAGSAYVYTHSNGNWTQEAKLIASDAQSNDMFGTSVSISGDFALVGAANENDNSSARAAYSFTRASGIWSEQTKLTASDGEQGDMFGLSVATSGNTALVSAYKDDDKASGSGSAYAFELSPPPVGEETIEVRISNGSDDAEERISGSVSRSSSDLELVFDAGGDQLVGLRFVGVNIPSGATITNAYVQFKADEINSENTNLVIHAQATDNASEFKSTSLNISSRPKTTSSVIWSPPSWNIKGLAGADQKTPDLASVIQEVINRPGWTSGNVLALIITGTGERTAESYEGDAAGAPLLHVSYQTGGANNPPNIDSFTVDPNPVLSNQTMTFSWSVSDIDGDSVSCSLDVDGDGTADYNITDCLSTNSQSHTYTSAGSYNATLTATDSNGGTDQSTIIVTVVSTTIERRIVNGSDDAEERVSGNVSRSSSDLELVFDAGGNQLVGLRFTELAIPQGAIISNAYVQFKTDEINSGSTSLTIHSQATDNALEFKSTSFNISSRPTSTALVTWAPPDWNNKGEVGNAQKTPNLSSVIQEIVNRPGWASGNALVLIISGTGERTAESYDGEPTGAPLLRIEYTSDSDGGSDTSDPPPPSTSVTIAAAGDIACDPDSSKFNNGEGTDSSCHMKAVAELIETMNPVAVLPLGDLQYEDAEFWKFEESYGPSWGRFNNIAYPAVGNHEYLTHDAEGYFNYFGSRAGDPDKGYYSYDKGNWHLIALNTNCGRIEGGCSTGGLQEQWLRNDLANTSANCVLAYAHHPRFSSGNHGNNSSIEDLWEALYDYDAELFLSGHDHNYERFAPLKPNGELDTSRGIVQFVVGTGGKSTRSMNSPERYSEFRDSDNHGALKLTLHSQSYDWEFVSDTGVVIDSGSAYCNEFSE